MLRGRRKRGRGERRLLGSALAEARQVMWRSHTEGSKRRKRKRIKKCVWQVRLENVLVRVSYSIID